ncbi:unnamed protein product [Brassica rapa]|uniref:Uncharacterized protein n=1 Tax=Brassica campestris TaxID=3711 RepID=A0A8D9FZK1_BRACM|nr:unnamed protein product [Brassica rapa]
MNFSVLSHVFLTNLSFLQVFNQMVLIFHQFKVFSDLEDFWDDLHVSRLKYNALDDFQEVFQTTSRKSSGLPGSRLDFLEVVWTSWKSSGLPGSRLDFLEDDLPVSRQKYNALDDFQEVFQTTSISVSSGLPGSRLDFLEVVWTSSKSSDKVFFHIKWSPSLSL